MTAYGPLVIGSASLVASIMFLLVAHRLVHRRYDEGLRPIALIFAAAWTALGLMALSDSIRIYLGLFAVVPIDLYATLALLKILLTGVFIWGLGVYVLYLWCGHAPRWNVVIGAFAATHALFFLYATLYRDPIAAVTHADAWVPRLLFRNPGPLPDPIKPLALPFYFLPPVLLAASYYVFSLRVDDPTIRFRVRATVFAIVVFQGANMIYSNPATPGNSPVIPVVAAATLVSGLVAYAAYHPPAWLAKRLAVQARQPVTHRPAPPRAAPAGHVTGDTLK